VTSGAALPRAVQDSIPGIVASLAPWGVTGAHQLPGPDGHPVLWLEISDEAERVAMQSQVWLSALVQVVLVRNGVPPHLADKLQVMFASRENTDRLLDDQ
jgi:hypothetical protein